MCKACSECTPVSRSRRTGGPDADEIAEADYQSYLKMTTGAKIDALMMGGMRDFCPEGTVLRDQARLVVDLEDYADKDGNGALTLEEYGAFSTLSGMDMFVDELDCVAAGGDDGPRESPERRPRGTAERRRRIEATFSTKGFPGAIRHSVTAFLCFQLSAIRTNFSSPHPS